jgi:hypothetical protein
MKKIYFLSALAVFVPVGIRAATSNLIQGGNMENASKWTVTQLDTVPADTAAVTFNYTSDVPTYGSGGCMRVTATSPAGGNNNVAIWQKVELQAGHRYTVDAGFKDIGTLVNGTFWCQWYLQKANVLPARGGDYSAEANCILQINTWNTSCQPDFANIDVEVAAFECQNGKKVDTVDAVQDTTYILVMKIGTTNAAQITYDILIDSVSVTDLGSTNAVNNYKNVAVDLYPNPTGSLLNIGGSEQYTKASILNVVGQEVYKTENFGKSINVNSLKPGVYFIKLTDANSNIAISKFQKR